MTENKLAIAIDSNPQIDPCLFLLNDIVNTGTKLDMKLSFSITLIVQGSIVSGELISEKLYFSNATKTISNHLHSEIIDKLFDNCNTIITEYGFNGLCLHLKNVVIRQATKSQDIELALIRIPLASVGGFSIAAL
jgi:hypothetical protein